ncbi:putative short-chain dehydrogenase [Xylaria cf. heliscus]|nr:putative short-chain dehydrogenase [Xylaria cf. heliscus]
MASLKGTLLITGTNGTLGSAIVSEVITSFELSSYYGIYTVRDTTMPTPALDAALANAPLSIGTPHRHSYDKLSLDLSKLSGVREAAQAINARIASGEIPPIRALVLNAGYHEFGWQTWTTDGLDMSFTVNYLSHWLLAVMLLQSMDREAGRIIWINSWSHNPDDKRNTAQAAYKEEKYTTAIFNHIDAIAKGTWSANKDDATTWMSGWRRYGAAKLCSVTMIHELQRRLDRDPALNKISVLSLDPGAMASGMVRRSDSWVIRILFFKILIPLMAYLLMHILPNGPFRTPRKSAKDVVAAAFHSTPDPLSERPKSLYLNGSVKGDYNPLAKDPNNWRIVWRASVQYARLAEGDTILKGWDLE